MDRCRRRPEISQRFESLGPYELQGTFVSTNGPFALFFREIRMDQWR